MTLMTLILSMSLVGCADDAESPFVCDMSVANSVGYLTVGAKIQDQPQNVQDIFATAESTRYESGSFCVDTYQFSQFNSTTYDWCYYTTFDVSCESSNYGEITSIYSDN